MGQKKMSRSTSYPSISLSEGLKKLSMLKDSLGVNGEYDREATAKGMGYGSLSGSSARAVAALVHYGLLNRSKDQYSISDLGKKYLMPIEEGQSQEAIREAVLKPALLHKIYSEYEGQQLPGQLKNILTITHGIQGAAADTALRVIKQSFNHAGLITDDGTLIRQPVTTKVSEGDDVEQASAKHTPNSSHTPTDSVSTPSIITTGSIREGSSTEQGINLAGNGWQLTVLLKTTKRHSAETRKKVRDLLEKADEVADSLYAEDDKE